MSLTPHQLPTAPYPWPPPPGQPQPLPLPPQPQQPEPRRWAPRHKLALYVGFIVAAVAVLVGAPYLPRTYVCRSNFVVVQHNASDAATHQPLLNFQPLLSGLRQHLYQSMAGSLVGNIPRRNFKITAAPAGTGATRMDISGHFSKPLALRDAINSAVAQLGNRLRRASRVLVKQQLAAAKARAAKADIARKAIKRAMRHFEHLHPDADPRAPNSLLNQYHHLQDLVEQNQSNLQVAKDFLKRLRALRQHIKAGGVVVPPKGAAPATVRRMLVRRDPQVVQLEAQLQLVEKQIRYQLTVMHRTNEHPYVRELRRQERQLDKQLRRARHRAAAGRPPPRHLIPPQDTTANPAIETLDLKIQEIQASSDQQALLLRLNRQRLLALQPRVTTLMPLRRALQHLRRKAGRYAAVADRRDVRVRRLQRAADGAVGLGVAVQNIRPARAPDSPAWPSFPLVLLAAVVAGCIGGIAAAALRHASGRSFRDARQFSALVEVPLLGVIDTLATPGQRRRRRFLQVFGVPLVVGAGVVLFVAAVAWCHTELDNAAFNSRQRAPSLLGLRPRAAARPLACRRQPPGANASQKG